ncbi:MAG TPA: type VI secretion system tube protein Hcp [Methylomirabilota bacterium]|nr:type VI secretion system tube protein Hcp [Methylomirabilota bacterium]
MRKIALALLTATVAALATAEVGHAAFDGYLFMQGLKGESIAKGREGWIIIRSLLWSHGQPGASATSPTPSRVQFGPLAVTKPTDSASPALALAAATGQVIPAVVIDLARRGDSNPVFLKLELFDVRITLYSAGGATAGADSTPSEELKLSYGRIRWTAFTLDPVGKVLGKTTGGWDLINNKPF